MNLKKTLLTAVVTAFFSMPAPGIISMMLYESDGDVIVEASGSVNLTDLTYWTTEPFLGAINAQDALFAVGPASPSNTSSYGDISGPSSIGTSVGLTASSGTGDLLGINMFQSDVIVPEDYVSGSPLSSTSTYENQTLTSMGITPGIYTWTWGNAVNGTDDSFTLTAIPEPTTYATLFGCAMLGLTLWKRRRA